MTAAAPSSRVLLLANIGTSDLKFDDEKINTDFRKGETLRSVTERILNDFEKHRADLSLPILDPVRRRIARDHPDANLDIFFFVTNQPEGVPQRDNDTIHIAKIIEKLWKEAAGIRPRVNKVKSLIIADNPHLADAMYAYYDGKLSRMADQAEMADQADVVRVFVSVTGGITACNMALIFHAIRVFGAACVPVFTVEGTGDVVPLQFGRQIGDAFREKILRRAVDRYDFDLADDLLQELNRPIGAQLARAAHYRLNFDFAEALQTLDEVVAKDCGQARDLALMIKRDLSKACDGDLDALIAELYGSMKACWIRGAYLDLLGRLFRLLEAILRREVGRSDRLGLFTDRDDAKKRAFKRYQAGIEAIPELKKHLDAAKLDNGVPLVWSEPNIQVLIEILAFHLECLPANAPHRETLGRLLDRCRKLQALSQLRNRSPLGHGFDGVSLKRIKKEFPGFTIQTIEELLADAEIRVVNPYDKVNEFLLSMIAR